MWRLPVSGVEVAVRSLDGADALLLQDQPGSATTVALALLDRVARPVGSSGPDGGWAGLTVTDFEVLIARLRIQALGRVAACGFRCPLPGCGDPVELALDLDAYLAPIRVRRPAGVTRLPGRPGWFSLDGAAFRLPTAGDQAAARTAAATACSPGSCLGAEDLDRRTRGRIERAMVAMAPEVSRPVGGRCPACARDVEANLHLPSLVVAELRRAGAR